ncbi:Eco57I restriction-modification methylase domain-containing protein [Paraburkholderia sp. HP33-1]|uniref:Eco57I restriction-modification methylase domain-containing protein n=1 Tax=Paraburkholderia sp. HP33-1 TaxID=2883243 RepID=UPI001F233AEF|nr:N-6 DNA methylase [Paraburkholderia sp. HP33-1]
MTVLTPLLDLVARFAADEARLIVSASAYQETEVRVEYIDPLLELLGWDMANAQGLPNNLKDILREESQEGDGGRPDYTFRIASSKKFFVEAKKPSVDITSNKAAAFQVRSYGHTVGLPVSILTNFRTLRIYDTRLEPKSGDDADVGLLDSIHYSDLPTRFSDLCARFGRDNVARGSIDDFYGSTTAGTLAVSEKFLARINGWRVRLANELHGRYPQLSIEELSDLAQNVVNRIIFLRMCEDRGIEARETLRKVAGQRSSIELRTLFKKLDDRYNTGLFDVAEDRFQDQYELNAVLFHEFVEEVYSPTSPYSFAVLDADFLGQVYEHFLAKRLELLSGGVIGLVQKPAYEDREIVTTPQPLVEEVIQRAVDARFSVVPVTTFEKLCEVRVLDVAIGSGRFLVHALDKLVNTAISILKSNPRDPRVYKVSGNEVRLRFEAKRQLLEKCLFGIDVDFNAVEVARFSLIVKLLEEETADTLPVAKRILPDLNGNVVWGNTVVGTDFHAPQEVVDKTIPIDWEAAGLPARFDVVIGNPPYVTTDDMRKANRSEFDYYKKNYSSSHKQFDKYFVFIERALRALAPGGAVGLLVPNKWLTIESAAKLRKLLADQTAIREVLNFGNESLFAGKSAYVCILVLQRGATDFRYRDIHKQAEFEVDPAGKGYIQPAVVLTGFGEDAWVLPGTSEEQAVLTMLHANSRKLSDLVDIKNGVQTSKNSVFVISNYTDTGTTVVFNKEGLKWEVEKTLTRPYVDDSGQVKSFCELAADALVIFPYRAGANGAPQVLSPKALRDSYPLGWAYLSHYRVALEERDVSPPPPSGVFYAFGRHQALETVFTHPKIIYSVNQTGNKYAFDTVGVAVASGGTAGEVMVLNPRDGYSLEFIMGLLNQRAIEYFVRKRGSPFRGGYYSRGSAVLADVPVPALDLAGNPADVGTHAAIVQNVREIMDLKSKLVVATGRMVIQLQRRLQMAEIALEQRFAALWGFTGQLELIRLPGE